VFLPSRRCLVRLLVAHITGRPPVDAPTPEEAARRAALVAEIAGRRAAEAERRRRATEVWVRVVRGGTGYRGTSIQIVGTLQDMENRRGEEDGIVDPMAEGLRTAHQLCGGRGVTNAQLFRLVQIRDDLEMEYDAPYGADEDTVRRLQKEETQILRAIVAAFRAYRAIFAPLATHASAVITGDVRHARLWRRRRAALALAY
jgi:hypothetical protein